MNFWTELRRRSVVRVAAVYLVTAWLVMQVVSVSMDALDLPGWVDGFVFVLLAAGFPVALVLAWAFELTPEGVKRSAPAVDGAPPARLASMDVVLIAAVVVLAGASLFQALRPPPGASVAEAAPTAAAAADGRVSIAVLPFADMSPLGDQGYFSDGLSEELLNVLAQIDDLRVIGRTSSFAFKGKNEDLRTIGDQLGAANILEGSVRKDDERLRITAQLVSAADGSHLWSQSYDRELTDVFAVQEEIARQVAAAMSVTLGVATLAVAGGTDDPAAHDAFLRGQAWANSPTIDGGQRALEAFREAVSLDPDYLDALLAVFQIASVLVDGDADATARRHIEAENAFARAYALAPDDWRVQQLAMVRRANAGDWAGAVEAARRARDAAPASERACLGPDMVAVLNTPEATLRCARAQRDADPLSLTAIVNMIGALDAAGRYDEAAAEYQRGRDLPGDAAILEYVELLRRIAVGESEAAIAEQFARYLALEELPLPAVRALAETGGDRDAALAILRDAIEGVSPDFPLAARVYGTFAEAYGDRELGLAAWGKATELGAPPDNHPWWVSNADMRRLPAFKDYVREIGWYDYWRTSGNWNPACHPLGADDFECG